MDNFDKHMKEVKGYLKKHVHFSSEESRQIRNKTTNKSSTKKFRGVYYIVLASTIVLFTILSIPLFNTLNFNSNPQFYYGTVVANETGDKISMNWEGNNRSPKILSDEAKSNLQLSIIKNPEKYKLRKASLNYLKKSSEYDSSIGLALSFQGQQNSYFTQIFKGEIKLEDNHEIIEKVGTWSLIPDSKTYSNMEENSYIIAVSEIIYNNEKYTIVVQTYDLHDDVDSIAYSKTDILDFTESLNQELAVINLLEIISED